MNLPIVRAGGRRALLHGAALALGVGLAPAAGLAQSGELSFMVAEYSPKTLPFWEKQVASFEAAHPDIDVVLEVVGWQQMHDTTVQRIAAGSLPDLVNTATIWLPEWVEAGAIRPIGPDVIAPEVQADIVPALLELGAMYKGESWGLPIAAAARGMFYNRAVPAGRAGPEQAAGDLGRIPQRR